MASHTARDDRGNELVTWTNGELSGDPDVISMLVRVAATDLTVGMVECELESAIGFRACCLLALGDNVTIVPEISDDAELVY